MTTESNNEGVVTPPPKNSYAVQMAQQLLELRQRANDGLINIDHYVNQASPNPACREFLNGVCFPPNTNLGRNYVTQEPFYGNSTPAQAPVDNSVQPMDLMDNTVQPMDNVEHLQDISVSNDNLFYYVTVLLLPLLTQSLFIPILYISSLRK